eukprot:gene12053-12195_t
MLQMMLVDNLIHSDLHPGNILVRLEPPRGLLGVAYSTLNQLARSFAALDGANVAQWVLKFSGQEQGCPEPQGWSNKLAPDHSVLNQVQGMFSPAMYSWHDRMDTVVDLVMDRADTTLAFT